MKGYEIFEAIANKKIKDGTQFRKFEDENIYTYRNNNFVCKYGGMNVIAILNDDFEIIEENEGINIQDIEELNEFSVCEDRDIKINELIKAIKKIDKEMKNND